MSLPTARVILPLLMTPCCVNFFTHRLDTGLCRRFDEFAAHSPFRINPLLAKSSNWFLTYRNPTVNWILCSNLTFYLVLYTKCHGYNLLYIFHDPGPFPYPRPTADEPPANLFSSDRIHPVVIDKPIRWKQKHLIFTKDSCSYKQTFSFFAL